MVIIIRRSSSFFSTSLTRTSSLSARSLTVMPFGERDGARDGRRRARRLRRLGALQARRGRCEAPGGRRARAAAEGGQRPGACPGRPGRGRHAAGRTHGLRRAADAGRRAWRPDGAARTRRRSPGRRRGRARARLPVAAGGGLRCGGGTTRGGCGTSWRRGLQRRRRRRRLPGFFDAQADAGRHEAARPSRGRPRGAAARRRRRGCCGRVSRLRRRGHGRRARPPARPAAPSTGRRRGGDGLAAPGGRLGGLGRVGTARLGVLGLVRRRAPRRRLGRGLGLLDRGAAGRSVGDGRLRRLGRGRGRPSCAAAAFALAAAFTAWRPVPRRCRPSAASMPRCFARRSTNCRATISSIVLDALFSSMPWSFLSSAITSWLVVLSSSATL